VSRSSEPNPIPSGATEQSAMETFIHRENLSASERAN
jgi:hypothetical protein